MIPEKDILFRCNPESTHLFADWAFNRIFKVFTEPEHINGLYKFTGLFIKDRYLYGFHRIAPNDLLPVTEDELIMEVLGHDS